MKQSPREDTSNLILEVDHPANSGTQLAHSQSQLISIHAGPRSQLACGMSVEPGEPVFYHARGTGLVLHIIGFHKPTSQY